MRKVDVVQLDSGGCQRAKADGWKSGKGTKQSQCSIVEHIYNSSADGVR